MIPDQSQREQAVLTAGHAFVRASAGTGKTHTLILRALHLLLTAPFDRRAAGTDCATLYAAEHRAQRLRAARSILRRFVLTTFTRKAAAEMQIRLYEYLDRLAGAPDLDGLRSAVATLHSGQGDPQFIAVAENALRRAGDFERLRRGAEALAELAAEIPVCTLHSFAAAILRRHPIAARIPPTARFAEEDDVTAADPAGQLVDRWWQLVIGDRRLREEFTRLAAVVPIQELRDWLVAIAGQPWIAQELDLGKPDARSLDELVRAAGLLVANLEAAPERWTGIASAREALRTALRRVERGEPGGWTEFCAALLDHQQTIFRKPAQCVKDAAGKLGPLARYFQQFAAAYTPALRQCLATDLAGEWETWKSFARSFAAWADGAAVRELHLVTFDEMVRRAARLVAENDAVRREERERLWALLVDEFQDTDPVQLGLLRALLRRDTNREHEVYGFFVGDPKQSIYRFRDADLPAILDFQKNYPALVRADPRDVAEYRLTATFRSLPPITGFVNQFFGQELKLPDCDYEREKLVAMRKSNPGPLPEWRVVAPGEGPGRADAARTRAAWETLRLIEDYIREKGENAYGDIVVLVNSHQELDALLPVLDRAGVPAVSSGVRNFFARPEVLDALNLLIALYNPHDALAVGALLRSPLFGLSDAQIYRALRDFPTRELFATDRPVDDLVPEPARRRIERMRRRARDRAATPLADWLGKVRAFVPDAVYARQDAEGKAVVRIDSALGAFRRAAESGAVAPLAWLLEQRSRAEASDRHDADLGEDVSVTDESVPAVRLMTIHKAKGLEGRFVIVFGWQKTIDRGRGKSPSRTPEILSLTSPGGEAVRGFNLPWGPLRIISPRHAEAAGLDRRFELEEGCRLAYVAATRAQDRLVLLSHDPSELEAGLLKEAAAPILERGQPAATIFDGSLTVSLARPTEPPARAAGAARPVKDRAAYAALWRERTEQMKTDAGTQLLHRPSEPDHPEEAEERERTDYDPERYRPARATALAAGTLVHRYLERFVADDRFEPGKLDLLRAAVADAPDPAPAWDRARRVLEELFAGKLAGPDGRPCLTRLRSARILARELPVYLTHDGKAWNGVIDLVLDTGDGILGVDYKISREKKPLPPEYDQQQRVYTEALRRLFPTRPVRFEFWWLEN